MALIEPMESNEVPEGALEPGWFVVKGRENDRECGRCVVLREETT